MDTSSENGWNSVQIQSLGNGVSYFAGEPESSNDKGEYIGTDDNMDMEEESVVTSDTNSDLGDIWNEMNVTLEFSKVTMFTIHDVLPDSTEDALLDEHEDEGEEKCEHSFILKDDIGDVCCICGFIGRGIEQIIEYDFSKGTEDDRDTRFA